MKIYSTYLPVPKNDLDKKIPLSFQPNFLITYLLRGRQRSTSRGCSPQEGVEDEGGVPLPWHRQSLTLIRQLEGHRLCVRFTKKEEASSSSKPNSLAREENNAIEIIPKVTTSIQVEQYFLNKNNYLLIFCNEKTNIRKIPVIF